MKLMDIVIACDARICGGSDYLWSCYGPDSRYLDFSDRDGEECVSLVFDTKTHQVYQVDMHVPGYEQGFVWRNADFEKPYMDECQQRGVEPNLAWDDVYYDVVDESTALKYARDIIATYYDDLPVPEDTAELTRELEMKE
jgi:hypothetical protein